MPTTLEKSRPLLKRAIGSKKALGTDRGLPSSVVDKRRQWKSGRNKLGFFNSEFFVYWER